MTDDRETMDMEEVVLVDEDGEEHTFLMLDAIEVDGSQYAILQPTGDELDDEEWEAVVLKIELDEHGEEVLVEIEDDDEWEKVVDIWQEIVEEDQK